MPGILCTVCFIGIDELHQSLHPGLAFMLNPFRSFFVCLCSLVGRFCEISRTIDNFCAYLNVDIKPVVPLFFPFLFSPNRCLGPLTLTTN